MVEIKFCGLTRAEDLRHAAILGARYAGVILTTSPREVDDDRARKLFAGAGSGVQRVGVFGQEAPERVAARAAAIGLDVVQLHGDPDDAMIARLREHWTGAVWAALRLRGSDVPGTARELFAMADAVVLDAHSYGQLGGTGRALPWKELRDRVHSLRAGRAKLVLAGGLTPDNVGAAIDLLQPDVVDVSSGVEESPGRKDAAKMRSFRDAVYTVQAR